ncbi:MAG: HNH endonuclease [Gemmatimonadales bacterium]|nr:MAG: HNH endonuclease [Gemmatimonadales bacterium]
MDALREDDPTCGAGCSHLDHEVRVSHETSRRLCCDATVVPLFLDAEERVADAGHARRVVSPALRRALEARDRGCRFPGCGLRYTEAHHVRHWADGGETSLENCVLICLHHHRLLHEGGWKMDALPGGRLAFRDPLGGTHYDGRFELPRLDFERRHFPVRELMRDNLRENLRGIREELEGGPATARE